ncbi:MAG: hypothetical protein C0404_05240 [Verrucomicrobia bacterium]|nr:hypothetical protein [Verrucomicrobiota bacterium]
MPAIGKILVIFFSALLLTRMRVPLGIALVVGGVSLNLWAGLGIPGTSWNLLMSLADPELWIMLAVMAFIIEIGRFLTEESNAKEIIGAVEQWGGRHGRSATLMGMPAVIGLIPMPAGALLSAPFVQKAGGEGTELNDWKASVNYWFRHVWEYWWPLYPGVIVAMSLFEMERWRFISGQCFFSVVAIGFGYFVLVRSHVGRLAAATGSSGRPGGHRALFLMLPIAIVVASLFTLPPLLREVLPRLHPQLAQLPLKLTELLGMLAGLLVALVVILVDELQRGRIGIFGSLLKKTSLSIMFSLFGVLVFKYMLESSKLLPVASGELMKSGIPVSFAVAGLPLLAGLVTGVAFGFTGTSFPLVVGMMKAEGSGLTPLSTLALAYGFGYIGMMLSPVHLCLLVTRDYFSSTIKTILVRTLPCMLAILAWAIIAHLIFGRFGL